jgi:hypothetical protein
MEFKYQLPVQQAFLADRQLFFFIFLKISPLKPTNIKQILSF